MAPQMAPLGVPQKSGEATQSPAAESGAASSAPASVDDAPSPTPKASLNETVIKLRPGSSLSQLLRKEKVAAQEIDKWIAALASVLDVRKLRTFDPIRLARDEQGVLQKLSVERSAWERAAAWREEGGFKATFATDPTETKAERVEFTIASSLYQALVDAGHDPGLAFDLADVFAWDIDFYSDVQRGDHVVAWVEVQRRRRDDGAPGEFIAYGRLLGARYDGSIGQFNAYRYQAPGEEASYYDEKGRSLRKEFLKSPLKYAHVTSRFGMRMHPVLGYNRQHAGIDFSASIGTPVWAVGDGKVIQAGWLGGYGKAVVVRHPNGLETIYGHLSQVLVRVGQHVAQKAVIAASGNTGLSSGPHLHFGIKRGGAFINPFSLKPQRTDPIAPEEMSQFQAEISPAVRAILNEV